MKSFVYIFYLILLVSSFVLTGCELFTSNPGNNASPPSSATNLVISEVFTLSPDKYYAYSWIEIYNPARQTFNWWTETTPAIAFACGDNGAAIYSTNNGVSWRTVNTGTSQTLRATSFPVREFGYAVGDNGTFIKFTLDTNGILHSSNNDFDSTLNRGKKNINGIAMGHDIETWGYMVGDSGLILRTTNRGFNWTDNTTTRIPRNLRNVIYNGTAKWAVGDSGTILRSTINRIWEPKAPPEEFPKADFKACTFTRNIADEYESGWAVGSGGAIAFTKSSGNIFTKQESGTTQTLRDVFYKRDPLRYSSETAWIVGDGGTILITTDMGTTWKQANVSIPANINKILMADSTYGMAFGENGTVLYTSNGGLNWFQLQTPSQETFWGAHFNSPNVVEDNKYILEIKAKRKEFFVDLTTGTVNYDVFVKIDTGYIIFDPAALSQQDITVKPVPPGGFTIINSDSIRFSNHTNLGPGTVNVINANIGYYFDTTAINNVRAVLWDLLNSGEIRMIRYTTRYDIYSKKFLQFEKKIIDVVRWGDFVSPDSLTYNNQVSQVWPQGGIYRLLPFPGNEPRFEQNKSMGYIPEWYSMARYANDFGNDDPSKLNTSESFYITNNPLPGWYSQKRK